MIRDGEDVVFDSADEIMSILEHKGKESVNTCSEVKWKANDPVIIEWYERGGNREWYLRLCQWKWRQYSGWKVDPFRGDSDPSGAPTMLEMVK